MSSPFSPGATWNRVPIPSFSKNEEPARTTAPIYSAELPCHSMPDSCNPCNPAFSSVVNRLEPDYAETTHHPRKLEKSRVTHSLSDERETDRRRHADVPLLEFD